MQAHSTPLEAVGASMNFSFESSATASSTVAKLSSTYCVQMLSPYDRARIARAFVDRFGQEQQALATSLASFMPSVMPMS